MLSAKNEFASKMPCTHYDTVQIPQNLYKAPKSVSFAQDLRREIRFSDNNWSLATASAYPPPRRLPTEMPSPKHPSLAIIHPTPQIQHTHILERPFRQLIIPSILHLLDLLALGEDLHLTINRLLHAKPFDLVHGFEVHLDWVAGASNARRKTLDLGESSL
jgi:hypothetical protein